MKDIPKADWLARFVCELVIYFPDGSYLQALDSWHEVITTEIHGENGFGYDPVFFDENMGITAAEMSKETKNSISHRAKALNKMKKLLDTSKMLNLEC